MPTTTPFIHRTSDPSDLLPITDTINGTWKIVVWTGTQSFLAKRQAGPQADHLFLKAQHTFTCDGVNFSQSQVLRDGTCVKMDCRLNREQFTGRTKVWSHVRNNVLETNQQIYIGGKNKIFVHENRYIKKGRLHISSHHNVRIDGEMVDSECLRIYERVKEGAPEAFVLPKPLVQLRMLSEGSASSKAHKKPLVQLRMLSDGATDPKSAAKPLVQLRMLPMVADIARPSRTAPKAQKTAQGTAIPKKDLKAQKAAQGTVAKPKTAQKAPRASKKARDSRKAQCNVTSPGTSTKAQPAPFEDEIPLAAEQAEPEDFQISPLEALLWSDVPNPVTSRHIKSFHDEIQGSWKLQRVHGWADLLKASRIDSESVFAASDLFIETTNIFQEIHTKYSTPGTVHVALDKLNEPMEKKNRVKEVFFEEDSLVSVTWDKESKKRISVMVRYLEDGTLKTVYECGEYKFSVEHQKVIQF